MAARAFGIKPWGHWDNSCSHLSHWCKPASSNVHREREAGARESQPPTRSHIKSRMDSEKVCLELLRRIMMIVGINVSDCFWYWLNRVILD